MHNTVAFMAGFVVFGGKDGRHVRLVNKLFMFAFLKWIIGHELSAAILKCAQVHLIFFFKFFPIQENIIVICIAGTKRHASYIVYKVHKIYLNMHNWGRVILSVK